MSPTRVRPLRPLPLLLLLHLLLPRTSDATAAASASSSSAAAAADAFTENLHLTPLPDGKVLAHFTFRATMARPAPSTTTSATPNVRISPAYGAFPKALGHVLDDIGATDMRLAFSRGDWDYDRWGASPDPSASGVELSARVPDGVPDGVPGEVLDGDSVDAGNAAGAAEAVAGGFGRGAHANWRRLRGALAGLFCASLDLMDERYTSEPVFVAHGRGGSGRPAGGKAGSTAGTNSRGQ